MKTLFLISFFSLFSAFASASSGSLYRGCTCTFGEQNKNWSINAVTKVDGVTKMKVLMSEYSDSYVSQVDCYMTLGALEMAQICPPSPSKVNVLIETIIDVPTGEQCTEYHPSKSI